MTALQRFIINLKPVLPLVLSGVTVAILAVILVILLIVRGARRESPPVDDTGAEGPQPPEPSQQPAAAPSKFSGLKLRRSFKRAIARLKRSIPGPDYRYRVPWVLMLGEAGAGKTQALNTGGLNLSLDHPFGKGPEVKQPCNWWFFERGVVLDIAGDLVLRADGVSSDQRLWNLLLRLLQKHRMERPIDSVVITVPCGDLIGPDGGPATDLTSLAAKADRLYQKIWQAQKILGMRFPIYILVTQCDRIEGFNSFCRELPDRFAHDIFGWSSPYGLNTAYAPEWVGEVFRSIHQTLSLVQYELFTRGVDAGESDGIFLFTESIRSLSEPLQIFMDHLFKQGAYHEALAPRGIYFCGSGRSSSESGGREKTFFVRNLFEKKIFAETGLGKPLNRTLLTRNRRVLALQIVAVLLALIGSFGLWRAYSRLNMGITQALPVFKKVVQDASELGRAYDITRSDVLYTLLRKKSPFAESAEYLLKNMGKIKTYRSVFMPTSWFSPINENNTKAMIHAFEEIILKGIYFQLHQKAKEIFLRAEQGAGEAPQAATTTVGEMPEFQTLRIFVRDLGQLEEYIRLYNDIHDSETVKPLGRLAAFLFGITLDESFYTDPETYLEALRRSRHKLFNPRIFRLKTKFFTLKKLTDRLYGKLFVHHDITSYLEALSLQLESFGRDQRSAAEDEDRIRTLLETFDRTEQIMQEPRYAYVFKPEFDLGAPFAELLDELGKLDFIGNRLISEIKTNGETAFRKLQDEIKGKQTALTGYLVERQNGQIQNRLSRSALALRDDLALLLDQEFMVFKLTPGWNIQAALGDRHRWELPLLEKTTALFEPYDGFIQRGLKNIPPELQHIITRMAQNGIENKLMENIAKAWKTLPASLRQNGRGKESDVLSEIRNFKAASGHLARLLEYFDQLDLMDSQQMLTELLFTQVGTLLTAVDGFLDEENLYTVKGGDFSWWDGREKLSLAAFNVVDETELENHLKLQRARIEHLALAFAEPLVEFAEATGIFRNRKEQQLLFKWDRIIGEIRKYNSKKPENTVTTLEKFIRFEMDEITPENYLKKISKSALDQRSGDLFLQKRNQLRRMLYRRNERLAARHVEKLYRDIQSFFTDRIAGRFPFSPLTRKKVYTEVLPEDIRDLYRLYDKHAAELESLLKGSRIFGDSGDRALAFLDQLKNVRHLFAAYLEGSKETGNFPVFASYSDKEGRVKTQAPSFDFDIEFRVNREYEIGGNRIIQWQLTAGDQVFRPNTEKRLGRWQYGDPLTVTLRWAKDAADYPVFAGTQEGVRIDGKSVTFVFDNQWSLIRMLALHAAAPEDLAQLADPKPHTLKFVIRTRTDGDDTNTPYEALPETRIFMRMTILTPGKKKEILVMPFFPTVAPALKAVAAGSQTPDPAAIPGKGG